MPLGSGEPPRFLTLADVAEVLSTTVKQATALVHRRELRAIRIGGRGQWRVESSELEKYIQRQYDQAARYLADAQAESEQVDEAVSRPAADT